MSEFWQTIVVAAILLAACAHIARAAWKTFVAKKSAGCGTGCAKCPANASQSPPTTGNGGFVSVDDLLKQP